MKQGNTVATILIISVMFVGAFLMVQTQVFPAQQDFLQRTIDTFSQFVFEEPKDVVQEYAMSGYQPGRELWYCGDYASPPTVEDVFDEFPGFAQGLLSGRLDTLRQEFPDLDIELSEPQFDLVAAEGGEFTLEHVVGVNVSNMTVTVQDGDRVVGMEYDEQYEYALRFWNIYATAYDWVTTGNGGIYSTIDEVMSTKQCAFYKDRCFCSTTDPEDYTLEGDVTNPCPCFEYLPHYEEENCESDVTQDCQDFTVSDREEVILEYGIQDEDLLLIGDRIAEQLTQEFDNEVTCSAQVYEPQTNNQFLSAYIQYPGACPVEELGGTCGIVPLNLFDTAACASQVSNDCYLCPRGGFKPDAVNAFNDDSVMAACIEASQNLVSECRERELEEGTHGSETIIECLFGNDEWIVMGPADEYNLDDFDDLSCNPQDNLHRATIGATGSLDDPPPGWSGLSCNPLPTDASPGPLDEGREMLENRAATAQVKQLSDIDNTRVDGMGGWLDRRGNLNIRITCDDPGGEVDGTVVEPMQAEFELNVVFRHGCDTGNFRFFPLFAPETCGIPAASTPEPPTCPQDDNPCTSEVLDENGDCITVYNDERRCAIQGEQCLEGVCMEGVCDSSEPVVTEGAPCGNPSACNACDEDGVCVPANDDNICSAQTGICQVGMCSEGGCEIVDIEDGEECPGVWNACGECTCQGGVPNYEPNDNDCDDRTIPVSCNEQEDVAQECEQSGNQLSCVLTEEPYDLSQCCGSEVCGSNQVCCPGNFCANSQDECGSQ